MKRSALISAVRRSLPPGGALGPGSRLVAGLSGGADSVALLDALLAVGLERGFGLTAAHLDHGLRSSSGEDAAFCARLCARLGVDLRTGIADVRGRARQERCGIEEAGRLERYVFLRRIRESEGAAFVAVAHTLDDQAETFLLRLLRGAGSAGLSAMRVRSQDVLRPLLAVSRRQVLEHLAARGLEWREDPSNADLAFHRNRVRHELLPYLERHFNPAIRATLARTAALLAEQDDTMAALGSELAERAGRSEGHSVVLDRACLNQARRGVARAALREVLEDTGGLRGVTFAHVDRILDLGAAPAPSGRRLPLPGGREAQFRFGEVAVGPRSRPASPFALPLAVPGRVALPGGGAVEARPLGAAAVSEMMESVVSVPLDRPLVVRTRRPGDRVRSRGREVSLKRYLMDRRVPADLRGALPLIAAGAEIVWVAGEAMEAGHGTEARKRVGLRFVGQRLSPVELGGKTRRSGALEA